MVWKWTSINLQSKKIMFLHVKNMRKKYPTHEYKVARASSDDGFGNWWGMKFKPKR